MDQRPPLLVAALTSLRAAVLLLALGMGACASLEPAPPDTAYQARAGRLAVVATEQAPEVRFEGFAHHRGEGAATGAGGTFAACLSGMGGGGCSGSACGAALLLFLGFCGVAGLVGGVAGAVAAPGAEQVAASEAAMMHAVEMRTVQATLRHAVEDAARTAGALVVDLPEADMRLAAASGNYRALHARGVDTVLETTLTRAGTTGFGIDEPSTAHLQAHVRVVDAASNAEQLVADYAYQGRSRNLAGWSDNEARALVDELATGFRSLGSHIYEQAFELYPFPDREAHSAGGLLSVAFGLAPIDPPTRGILTGDRSIGSRFEWFEADTLQPNLRWQAFPRPGDVAASPEDMARVRDVRYELVIAREENMAPGPIVYRRTDLPRPEHALAVPLQAASRYFWSVRARFVLDGRWRVTEWGTTSFLPRDRFPAPSRQSYRFRTP